MSERQFSRRGLIGAAGAVAGAPAILKAARADTWPIVEGPGTPKICMNAGARDEVRMRRLRQIGVSYALSGGPKIPWQEAELKALIDGYKAGGLTLYNLMIGGFNDAIYARPGRDEAIENVIKSIRAAGKAGLPVIEYNWYAHRATEGYYAVTGRAGVGHLAFDYDKIKDLPPLPNEGAHTLDEMWTNITYFLKAVVPVAVESGVRLALHPNDPPAPLSRGSQQIMATLAGWKKLIEIVPSPANGITFDCGVTRELGEDPVEVCRYFASRKRINHMHFRNVRVEKPYEKYTEVVIDEGVVNMFAVMREVVKQKYTGTIFPEHPRGFDYDTERGKGGGAYTGEVFNVAYARAMLQAALEG